MRTAAVLLAYAAVLAFGLHQTFRPTLESGFARMQTERGDGMLNHYILEHSWQSLTNPDYCGSLFSPPCFYPTPSTLWYSEHLLGVAPVYWALRVVLPYDHAYQWWQIILQALNFVSFALVVRWLRGPHALAVLGGYLWAFSLINLDQIKHQQMIPRFAMALAAYHAWQFVTALGSAPANPTRHLNRMMAAVFLQAVTCVNTGWFLVSGLATFLPLALTLRRRGWWDLLRFAWGDLWRVLLVVGGWTAALVGAYVPYLVVNWGLGRSYQECVDLMPRYEAWFAGVPGNVWESVVAPYRRVVLDESWLFCGFGLLVLMGVALAAGTLGLIWRGRRREYGVAVAALLTAAVWVALTLKVGGDRSLWESARHVPGGTAIRCVSRVYVTVYLFGSLGAIVWLARATERLRPSVRGAVLWAVAAACVAEQCGYKQPSFDKRDFYALADRTAEELKKGDIGYVVPYYTDTRGVVEKDVYGEVFGMWCGLRANVPVVNGYSGRVPSEAFLHVLKADMYRENELRKWLKGRFRGKLALVDPDNLDATKVLEIE